MRAQRWKRPESVLVVVYTVQGDVLLLRRRTPKDFWQSVTGSLKWDESPAHAARREVGEETGLGAQPTDCRKKHRFPILPAWRARYAPDVSENTEHVFALVLPARHPVRINSHEHSQARWLPKSEAVVLATSWTNRDAILELVPEP
jgi:dATP pyrophosphohydrolase